MDAVTTINAVGSTAKNAADVLDRLGVIEAVRNKLVNNPDRAALHLVKVLGIIEHQYQQLENQILGLTTLEFRPRAELNKSRTYLRRLKINGLRRQITDANNACRTIKTIYRRWLRGWFSRVLNQAEQKELEQLFDTISILDDSLVGVMWGLSNQLRPAAESILDHVDRGEIELATRALNDLERKTDPVLRQINDKFVLMQKLKGDFHTASRAIAV